MTSFTGVFQKIQDNNRSKIGPSPRQSRFVSSNNTTSVNVAPAVVQQPSRQQSSSSHNSTIISAPVSSLCPHCKRPFSALTPTLTDQVAHRQNYVPDRNGQQMTFSRQPLMNNVNSAQRGDHQYSNSTNPPQVAANLLYQNRNIRSNDSIVTPGVGFGNGVVYPDPTLTLKGRGVDHQYSNSTKLPQVAANLQQYAAPQYHNIDLGNNNNIHVVMYDAKKDEKL
ncbi:hypothetical protein HAX54_025120 [Datura stramonium]|uniref:Uncharacterized protein n=1 Tax=Datura stramonium TaxID=4076 RepID=A0ABS8S6H9_DATST|nr:hypothetical protein [Datura stramonium]